MLSDAQVGKIKKEFLGVKDRMPVIFSALGDPGRFRIFQLLIQHNDICVSDVAHVFNITVSAASQQLRILEMLELVKKIRMGQMVCFELNKDNPVVKQIVKFIKSI